MTNPDILNSEAYHILSTEVVELFKEGREYECNICFKLEFKRSVIQLDAARYDKYVFKKCNQEKTKWVCKSCDKHMKQGKIPPCAQANNMYLCPKIPEIECLWLS